ncbi:hypothetical protein pmac_cds_239 [Pandoravirus macleodensis]|uniref:Uncharacterized protein n=1 Tax=Pandoravirus macleodensis TaxID=2107707 RepID=A0A2U7UER2_9VIRU|nr:hypothetical protein pmac_cds_239 [Pandoravirus macleodensis]AVK76927.1 hypothetical protein pmac_cds_239 [Pandoravirus macleodensis]
MTQRHCAICVGRTEADDVAHVLRKRDPPPPGPATPHSGGAIVYSPVLPHGFAVRLAPGPVDATTAARAAFSVSCLRSTGPVCRNVLGPLAHTLGRYFAGGGCVSVATRTGVPRNHQSLDSILAWRRPTARPGEGDHAARRWLASCVIAQVDSVRWHPRYFVPCDAALDLVYAYLANAVAPASLLRATCSEIGAWLARSHAVLARLTRALAYAETQNVLCPINVQRLASAFDALPRCHRRCASRQQADATCDIDDESAAAYDVETAGCGCPSPYACTAWGPGRSVGAWQRSALNCIAFVAATPTRAVDPAHLRLGYRPAITHDDMTIRYTSLDTATDSAVAAYGDARGHMCDEQRPEQSRTLTEPTAIAPCLYSMPINVDVGRTTCLTDATTVRSKRDTMGDLTQDNMRAGKRRCINDDHSGGHGDDDKHIINDDDGPRTDDTADPDSPNNNVDAIDSDAFWQWINRQFSTEIDDVS